MKRGAFSGPGSSSSSTTNKDRKMQLAEQLVLDLSNPDVRENALRELSKLYQCTLEPIVGPEFWQHTTQPRPRPPNVRIAAGRPKKKRSTKNDLPQDPTRVSKVGTIVNCTYYKARGHNTRTCEAKKNDMLNQGTEKGQEPSLKKSRKVCHTCNTEGHNSRTCVLKKQQNAQAVVQYQDQQTLSQMMQKRQGSNQCTQASSTSGTRKKLIPKKKNRIILFFLKLGR